MSLGMGLLLGAVFASSSYMGSYHNYGLEVELSKQNSLKEEENNLKALELKIRQYEKYTNEELLEKFYKIDSEEEIDVEIEIRCGKGYKTLHTSNYKDKIKNTQHFKNLKDEVARRGLFLNNGKN